MPGRAAGGDLDRSETFEVVFGDVLHLVEKNPAVVQRDAAFYRLAHGARLLVNLFEHEVFEAALFGFDRIPGDALHRRLDFIAREIGDPDCVLRHHSNLAVAEKENVAGVLEDRGNV